MIISLNPIASIPKVLLTFLEQPMPIAIYWSPFTTEPKLHTYQAAAIP